MLAAWHNVMMPSVQACVEAINLGTAGFQLPTGLAYAACAVQVSTNSVFEDMFV
jgi:hypothetical protein